MTLTEYRTQTTRTLPDKGSLVLNSIHMTLGLMTEIAELIDCKMPQDIFDESMDITWYLSNYCNIHNLKLVQEEEALSVKFINVPFLMVRFASELQDQDKKNFVYYKLYNRDVQQEVVQRIFDLVHGYVTLHGYSIEDGMYKNIEKLKVRYPEKFDGNLAINKDEAKEKEVFK